MIGYLLYCDTDGNYIDELCGEDFNLAVGTYFVPCIGETFFDKNRKVEYEVKDIIRSIERKENGEEAEYGIEVLLEKREKRKYKVGEAED